MRLRRYLSSALLFLLPFAVLLVLWAVLIPWFNVNPRLFPTLGSVVAAGIESIRDGTLPAHIGASLLRVFVGTVLALAAAIPLGVLMGVSPVVSRSHAAVPLLLGARRHRLDPDRDALVRLRLRRDHLRDLQRGVLHRHLQHAARRLDHSAAGAQRRRLARRRRSRC
jgi:hypothetical protein